MEQKRGIIVFSGFNQRAVIAFIRTLEKLNVRYAIIAKSQNDTILLSHYKVSVMAIRRTERLLLDDILCCLKIVKSQMSWNSYLIAPTSEGLNRFLLANRSVFEQENMIIPLVNDLLYQKISDKYSFSLLCKEYDIEIPNEYADPFSIELPFVAKPKHYFNKENKTLSPVLLFTEEDRKLFFDKFGISDFYYEDFITGESFYLLYYFDGNKKVFKFSQKNIAQQSKGRSMIAAISSNLHNSELSSRYEKMFIDLDFRGFVMIEVRKRQNEYFMIEANPRFWGPSQLFVDARKNFFEVFLYDYSVVDNYVDFSLTDGIVETKYLWYGGIVQMYKEKEEIAYHVPNINLERDLPFWLQNDVYMREDSLNIFRNELN